ncbi:MAG: hypothetical protein ACJ74Y_00695, partial [Bryobacteraceae bacterium]
MLSPPDLEHRSAEQFSAEVRSLLGRELPGWPVSGHKAEAGEALVRIFGHLCGTVADRLNRAPYKNLLAFLELQGISLGAAQAARVPLTFQLTEQHLGHVKVPAYTQVAATPEPGEKDPILFETAADLIVTPASLTYIGTKDGTRDRFSDYSFLSRPGPSRSVPILRATTPISHLLILDLGLP